MIYREVAQNRTADVVVAQVESLILDGVLRPGDRLPSERELARALDVSRPILREALDDLAARGLVESRHGGGTYVADVIGEVFRQPVVALVRSHPRVQADYLAFRREVDAIAAGLAAERANADDRALLRGILERLDEAHAAGDVQREAELDVEFHLAVSDCTHNTVLLHTLRACYRLLADGVFYNRALLYGEADCRDRLHAQHHAVAEAILAGDGAAARAAAAAHMDYVAAEVAARQEADARAAVSARRRAVAEARLDGPRGGRGPALGLTETTAPGGRRGRTA
ncbi:GntR family transcriptional regulator [Oharaeibacter diazotrophicus]|uniref:Pyruvate dehydrogenase complex repressor n=2 Tax=Oharaeibacter diazotrophicus TaxID=1920512 RepID=A0A4R6RCQ7_9HYPH|nr:GntR family transcriptional regulator [Oharaeibacter diazotrophicus]TDP83487.1 GntR family transcriptional regulator [Oharaeibacter diazotrophicus]BBE72320.1 pyruvate dehydrogenase complex repressor [Pleomorphomonas sp. SM30]GLS79090.1 GntR family transcriptional regulator [Oharaeibacter diazotrophicus]